MKFWILDFRFWISRLETRDPEVKTRSGFTLLEVVVAMAIVGLGVVTLLELFSAGLRLETKSSATTEAVAYGRQLMDGILIRPQVKEGQEGGSLGESYRWSVHVKRFQEVAPLSSTGWELREVALEMHYRDGDRDRQVDVKTLRLVKKGS